jgi:dienelactone hydrolase
MKMSRVTIALGCLLFLCHFAEAGTSESQSNAVPRIQITPNPAFVDQPVKIVLRDFPARQIIAVQLQLLDTNLLAQTLQSHAEFLTDRYGNADLATQAPTSGTYHRAGPAGLFWSLSLTGSNTTVTHYDYKSILEPKHYEVTAAVNGRIIATATMERFVLCPGVRQIQVRDHGLRGTLFLPAGKGPWPGVIVVGGSEGGLPYPPAVALLAAKGYAAFALAYFNYEDLPISLENIPLEYFQTAIHWLQARDDIRRNSLAVMGGSRGGELALLLGATFSEVHAVVAISASGVLWGGLGTNADSGDRSAWTWQGKPLPCMNNVKLTDDESNELNQFSKTNSKAAITWFLIQHGKQATVTGASIPVEKINGPVLLISGDDDQLWPSTKMEDMIMKRLKEAQHPFPDRHLTYPGAGHIIPVPNAPTTSLIFVRLGGDPEHIAAAATDVWPRIVDFLNQSLNLDRH